MSRIVLPKSCIPSADRSAKSKKEALFGYLLVELARLYKKHHIIMQLHFAVTRNVNGPCSQRAGRMRASTSSPTALPFRMSFNSSGNYPMKNARNHFIYFERFRAPRARLPHGRLPPCQDGRRVVVQRYRAGHPQKSFHDRGIFRPRDKLRDAHRQPLVFFLRPLRLLPPHPLRLPRKPLSRGASTTFPPL